MSTAGETNADVAWNDFDPEAYFAEYYGEPHPDDVSAAVDTARFLQANAAGKWLDCLDVGTGASLLPLLAALPVAASMTAWEYGAANIAWLRAEVQRETLRPQWQTFWSAIAGTMRQGQQIPDPVHELGQKTTVIQGSIFDLPAAKWSAASMFFCAESITSTRQEFEQACQCFARAARPGAPLVAAFLAGSRGYSFGDARYPAVPVDEALLREIFVPLASRIGIRSIRSEAFDGVNGYDGMLLLTAIAGESGG